MSIKLVHLYDVVVTTLDALPLTHGVGERNIPASRGRSARRSEVQQGVYFRVASSIRNLNSRGGPFSVVAGIRRRSDDVQRGNLVVDDDRDDGVAFKNG